MAFLTLSEDNLRSDDASRAFEIFVSPRPDSKDLPTVWLDLHVDDKYYQNTDDTNVRRSFHTDSSGKKNIWIRARKGVRLVTRERVGCDAKHIGIVMNVASRAKHGLIVAPGKIDPGYGPNRLILVVFNQSNRRVRLCAGDKIASVAFAGIEGDCPATNSHGHANGVLEDYESPWKKRAWARISTIDYGKFIYDMLKILVIGAIPLFFAWLAGYLELPKP